MRVRLSFWWLLMLCVCITPSFVVAVFRIWRPVWALF